MTPYLASIAYPSGQPLNVTYPHCDWRVLHQPRACQYCDLHPTWQQERIDACVLFTDDSRNDVTVNHFMSTGLFLDGFQPCPAWLARGQQSQWWGGNVPLPHEGV